jgi:putative ABC transport system permease protein
MADSTPRIRFRFWIWLIRFIGVIVPRRVRANWRQEWESELRNREALLADWHRLDWRNKLDLFRRSLGAFWDALWMQTYRWEDEMIQDLRFGLRMLLKQKSFTVVAVISLALGIGANTAIFSVVNGLLITSMPYHDPERLVLIWGDYPAEGKNRSQVSATDVADWRAQHGVFEDVTTYGNWTATFLGDGEPERIHGIQVGDGYFEIMRGVPLLGRGFLPDEQVDGKDRVLVLSFELWQRRFGGDPEIVGKATSVGVTPYTIVGVMPQDFRPLPVSLVDHKAEFYRPVAEGYDEEERDSRHLRSIARLKPEVTLEQAQTEMSLIAARLEASHPASNTGYGVRLATIGEDTVGKLRRAVLMLFGAVAFVLLIACANVGNLLLVRSTARHKEVAIRCALGAAPLRLVRQLLTEAMLLALLGGTLGLLLGVWGTSVLQSVGSKVFPSLSEIKLDWRVLGFTIAVSLVTGVILGLVPAMSASKPDLIESLKEGGRSGDSGAGRSRLRNVLVMSEVAMALVLLVCAGLMIRSVIRLGGVSPGFNPEQLLTMNVSLPQSRYRDASSWTSFHQRLLERTEALPGAKSAGLVSVIPLSKDFDGRGLAVEDHPRPPGEEFTVDLYVATPGYLRAMEIPLLSGRTINEQDAANTQLAALINETMARELWSGEDPLGKRIKFPGSERNPQPWRTIVGVVADVKQYGIDERQPMQIYLPEAQYPVSWMSLVVRTSNEPTALASAVRAVVRELDKDLAVFNIVTMDELLSDSNGLRRFSMLLLGVFAGLALTLAAVGIYGVISYSVTQRTREIGTRIALGASSSNILRLVLKRGLLLAISGVAIGLISSLALTGLMTSLLFGISATDPLTFAAIAVLLTAVAAVACYLPARRAMKVDPMVALRYE